MCLCGTNLQRLLFFVHMLQHFDLLLTLDRQLQFLDGAGVLLGLLLLHGAGHAQLFHLLFASLLDQTLQNPNH